MSDLLARLASRATGSRPILRPRLGGLFEPAGLAATSRVDVRDGAPPPPDPSAVPVPALAPRLPAPAPELRTPGSDPAPGPPARRQPRALAGDPGAGPVPVAGATPAPPERRQVTLEAAPGAPTAVPPEPALRELRHPEPASGTGPPEGGRRERAGAEERHGREPDLHPAERVIVERRREVVERSVERANGTPAASAAAPQPAHAVSPARSAPAVTPPAARRDPAPTAAPEPTVRVTIGRLEVRVRPLERSRPARAAERPAPAVMGLDEYLARRTGGGR